MLKRQITLISSSCFIRFSETSLVSLHFFFRVHVEDVQCLDAVKLVQLEILVILSTICKCS